MMGIARLHGLICEGKLVSGQPVDEAEHYIRCAECNGWIDCRNLGKVFAHEGPLPHPAEDQPQ